MANKNNLPKRYTPESSDHTLVWFEKFSGAGDGTPAAAAAAALGSSA
jgi:hypothetical protein